MQKSMAFWRDTGHARLAGMLGTVALVSVGFVHASAQTQLPGKFTRFEVKHSSAVFVSGLNKANTTVGYYIDPTTHDYVGFVRTSDGRIITFAAPGATDTAPVSVNDGGAIAGVFQDAEGQRHGFVRSEDGTFAVFDPQGSTGTDVAGMNDKGVVTGQYEDNNGIHGFVRTADGTIASFDAAGSNDTEVMGVNDKGTITGSYTTGTNDGSHGFIRMANGTITSFDAPGADFTAGTCINGKGVIAGSYGDGGGLSHAFVRAVDGTFTSFDGPQSTETYPVGIDDRGTITGVYFDTVVQTAFVRAPDGTITNITPKGEGKNPDVTPGGINNAGTIAGYFDNANNDKKVKAWGFILSK